MKYLILMIFIASCATKPDPYWMDRGIDGDIKYGDKVRINDDFFGDCIGVLKRKSPSGMYEVVGACDNDPEQIKTMVLPYKDVKKL